MIPTKHSDKVEAMRIRQEASKTGPLVPASGSVKRKISPAATSIIELGYNGDYPGYPVVRINGKWLTDEQCEFLLSLVPVKKKEGWNGLREFYDWCGAKMIPGSREHEHFEGTLQISISRNGDSTTKP